MATVVSKFLATKWTYTRVLNPSAPRPFWECILGRFLGSKSLNTSWKGIWSNGEIWSIVQTPQECYYPALVDQWQMEGEMLNSYPDASWDGNICQPFPHVHFAIFDCIGKFCAFGPYFGEIYLLLAPARYSSTLLRAHPVEHTAGSWAGGELWRNLPGHYEATGLKTNSKGAVKVTLSNIKWPWDLGDKRKVTIKFKGYAIVGLAKRFAKSEHLKMIWIWICQNPWC